MEGSQSQAQLCSLHGLHCGLKSQLAPCRLYNAKIHRLTVSVILVDVMQSAVSKSDELSTITDKDLCKFVTFRFYGNYILKLESELKL